MIRLRVVSLLSALALAVTGGVLATAPAGAATQLSEGCAFLHSLSTEDVGSSGTIFLSPKSFSQGEQVSFTGFAASAVDLVVNVNFPNDDVQPQHGTSGVPIRYTVPFDTGLSFLLTSVPQSLTDWKIDCGLPAKQPQTITFPDAPTGLVWGRDRVPLTAYSSSGLPVTYSLDPASTGCSGPYPYFFGQSVAIERPGTCVVNADQAGDDEFEAAATKQIRFAIGRRPSSLTPARVTKGLLNLFPTTFKATLQVDDVLGPGSLIHAYAGQPVTFTVDGTPMCTGTTDANGEARCTAKLGWTKTLNATSYTATWAGDDLWAGSTATGVLK